MMFLLSFSSFFNPMRICAILVNPDNEETITLGCGNSNDGYNGEKDTCESCNSFGYDREMCVCTGNLCNGSGKLGGSHIAAVAVAIASTIMSLALV